jgi:hypothetical protein
LDVFAEPYSDLEDRSSLRGQILRGLAASPPASRLLQGLRGYGKSHLLRQAGDLAGSYGCLALQLVPLPRQALGTALIAAAELMLARLPPGDSGLANARRAVADFATSNRDRFAELLALLLALGALARSQQKKLLVIVDDLHDYSPPSRQLLFAVLTQLQSATQSIVLLGAGFPDIALTPGVQPLSIEALRETEAAEYLIRPAARLGVKFEAGALQALVRASGGHPAILRAMGQQAWSLATGSPIRLDLARLAIGAATAALDAGFFRWKFAALAPLELRYLRAMAEVAGDCKRSGAIAVVLQRPVSAVAPTRASLIGKGLLYCPRRGETAFTTPLYAEFLRRTLPPLRLQSDHVSLAP